MKWLQSGSCDEARETPAQNIIVAPPQRAHASMPGLLMPVAIEANCANYVAASAARAHARTRTARASNSRPVAIA